jgi:hypothetical protein
MPTMKVPLWKRHDLLLPAAAWGAWLVIVVWLSSGHAVWRDETRALSLALEQPGFFELFSNPPRDGHPLVWFTLLRAAYAVVGETWVLKLVSVAIGAAFSWLLLFKAPAPLWLRVLLAFSGVFVFDYAVIARNYGISALLLFLFAHGFSRPNRNAGVLAVLLFLLANTNVHSAILAIPLGLLWAWDEARQARRRRAAAALAVLAVALGLCFFSIYPSSNQLAINNVPITPGTVLPAIFIPCSSFDDVAGFLPGVAFTVVIWAAILSLKRLPLILAAAAGTLALSLFFGLVYPGGARHEGLWIAYVFSLMWIRAERYGEPPKFIGALGLAAALIAQLPYGFGLLTEPRPLSRSQDVAALTGANRCLGGAIIIADPDYMADALPYYLANPIYSVREQRFTKVLTFPASTKQHISLGYLLDVAQKLSGRFRRPVLILMHDTLQGPKVAGGLFYSTRISAAELERFGRATTKLAALRPSRTDEEYDVYLVDTANVCSGGKS